MFKACKTSLVAAALPLMLLACAPGGGEAPPSSEDMAAALEALGLGAASRASWRSQTIEDGTVTFDNFVFNDDDGGGLTVDTLVIDRPRLVDGAPVVDAFDFQAGIITYEDGEASFEQFLVSEPGPALTEQAAAYFQRREAEVEFAAGSDNRFGQIRVLSLAVDLEDDSGGPSNLNIDRLEATDFDGDILRDFTMETLRFEGGDDGGGTVAIGLDRVQLEGFAGGLMELDDVRPLSAPTYESFLVEGLALNASGLIANIASISGDTETRNGGQVVSTVQMPNLTVSAQRDAGDIGAQFASALDTFGFEELVFSLQSTTVYDPMQDRVRTEGENALVLRDGFRLSIEQDLSGVTAYGEALAEWVESEPDAINSPPADILELLKLHRLVIEFEDEAFFSSVFSIMAEQQNSTPEAVRAQAAGFVAFAGILVGGYAEPALVASAQTAVVSLINQGGTLQVAIEPQAPLPMSAFTEGRVPEEAGLSVSHAPPED